MREWKEYGHEWLYIDRVSGVMVGRVVRQGCCWWAYLGEATSAGRFRDIRQAKRSVEHLSTMVTNAS
jgi:hypothetical protein